jgi:hypothetical protein
MTGRVVRSGRAAAAALAGVAVMAATACGDGSEAPRGARLSARWTGADTAAFSGAAVAEWCAPLRILEIHAAAGDTGLGIALYPPDTLDAGPYPVRRPDLADTALPPSAAVALRWFSQTTVMGYQGDSGRVTLERRADGSLAGRFNVGARPFVTGSRLHLTGQFEGVRVIPAPARCVGRGVKDSTRADSLRSARARADSTR